MHQITTQRIPKIAGGAMRIDLAALLGQFFSNIFGFFQRLFRPRNLL